MKLKYFCSLVGIETAFLFSFYFFLLFIINKLRSLMSEVQSYTADIGNIESIMSQNMSLVDLDKLSLVTGTFKDTLSKFLGYIFLGILGIFLLYSLFQGINWNLAYNFLKDKFKINYKYLLKFSLVSIIVLSLSIFFSYHILLSARYLLVGKLLSSTIDPNSLFKLIAYCLLLILWLYISFIFYALLSKYNLKETIKKFMENLKIKSFLYFLVGFFGVLFVIYIFLQLQIQSIIVYLVEIVIISIIVEKFRIYLLRNI